MADVKEGSQEAEKVKRRRWIAREGCALRRLRMSLETESASWEVVGSWRGDGGVCRWQAAGQLGRVGVSHSSRVGCPACWLRGSQQVEPEAAVGSGGVRGLGAESMKQWLCTPSRHPSLGRGSVIALRRRKTVS